MTDTARVFRLSVARFWLWAGLLYAAFVLVVYGLIRYSGRELDPVPTAAVGLFVAIVAGVYGWTYRAEVSADGLGFTDPEGNWVYLTWAQITWAERTRSAGLPLLELKVAGHELKPGLLLLFGNRRAFAAAVAAAAGPRHPITWALTGRAAGEPCQ